MNAPLRHIADGREVRVAWQDRPFASEVKVYGAAAGQSIAEILADMPDLPPFFLEHGSIRINDEEVPRAHWGRVRPRPDTRERPVIMTLHVAPGSSGTLRTIASIAVLVAAVAISAGALGPAGLGLLGSSFASGGIGAAVLGAGVAIAGSLAISALTPSPTLTDAVGTTSAGAAGMLGGNSLGSASSASLSGNVLARGRGLPRSIGTNRLFPPLICQPLIDWDGTYEIAEAVFGLAGPHQISALRVGETAIDSFTTPEVTVEVNDGTNPAAFQVALVQRQGATDAVNVDMGVHTTDKAGTAGGPCALQPQLGSNIPATRIIASHDGPDEIWISLAFGEGLYFTSDPSKRIVAPFRIQIKKRGDVAWINLPELHVSCAAVKAFEQMIRLKFNQTVPAKAGNEPPAAEGCVRAYKLVPQQTVAGGLGIVWQADSYFSSAAGNDVYSRAHSASSVENVRMFSHGATFYLNGSTQFPQTIGGIGVTWEIAITQGAPYQESNFEEVSYGYGNGTLVPLAVHDWFYWYNAADDGLMKQAFDVAGSRYKAGVPRIASVWNQHPVQKPDFATIAVKVVSRQLGELSCLASAYVPDWNGSSWTGRVVTSNPAPHFRQMLVDSAMNKSAIPTSMVDDPQLVTWRQRCITKGYFANCVLEGQALLDGLNLVAAAGFARPRMSDKWGVVMDYDRSAEVPVQVFSARNMKGFSFQKGFPKRPDGLRIQYRDAAQDYISKQIEVGDPAVAVLNVFEEISYDSLTSTSAVQARALFDIAQSKLRSNFYSGEVPIEAIVAVRGDLVGVNHDILSDYAGAARIKSITRSGGRITQILLDGTVPGPNTGFLGIAVRLADFSLWIQTTIITSSTVETDTITFSGSGPLDPGSTLLTTDCLLVSGKAGTEYKRMILFAVSPKENFTADITLVDEAPTLPF